MESELRHRDSAAESTQTKALGVVLALLGVGMASAALLGPLVLDLMRYRTSPTTLNQLLGVDATILFVLGGVTVVLAWRAMPRTPAEPTHAVQRTAGWVLLAMAAFLVLGLHLRTMVTAWTDPQSMTEYASSPTPFWMVKLMDLGIIVPVALAVGWGLLHGAEWALRVTYPLFTGYTCLALSVTGMAVVMLVNDDPDASLGLATGFAVFALGFLVLTVRLYRALLGRDQS